MLNFYLIWNAPVLQAALRGLYDMVIVRSIFLPLSSYLINQLL
jgi:hypothetical protein